MKILSKIERSDGLREIRTRIGNYYLVLSFSIADLNSFDDGLKMGIVPKFALKSESKVIKALVFSF